MTLSLLWKAWIESRLRFFAGLLLVAGICAFFVFSHSWILDSWKRDRIVHPDWVEPPWLLPATESYSFFLWHFLPDSLLQQTWGFCAVLLGIGGLNREAAEGSAGFTLSLPASRRALFLSRIAVGFVECATLALAPAILLPLFSTMVGQQFSVNEGLIHGTRLLLGGFIIFAWSVFLASSLESVHLPSFIGLSTLAVSYLFVQPYTRVAGMPFWIRVVGIRHLMSSTDYSSRWVTQGWMQLTGSTIIATALMMAALQLIERRDY